jgi:hypothetical protein
MRVGDKVRLKKGVSCTPGRRATAIIEKKLKDIKGGVILNRDLDGTKWWNVSDLELVK